MSCSNLRSTSAGSLPKNRHNVMNSSNVGVPFFCRSMSMTRLCVMPVPMPICRYDGVASAVSLNCEKYSAVSRSSSLHCLPLTATGNMIAGCLNIQTMLEFHRVMSAYGVGDVIPGRRPLRSGFAAAIASGATIAPLFQTATESVGCQRGVDGAAHQLVGAAHDSGMQFGLWLERRQSAPVLRRQQSVLDLRAA